MNEARKITAQYLNGLAVAVVATVAGAYIAGDASALTVAGAGLGSLLVHLIAVRLGQTGQ